MIEYGSPRSCRQCSECTGAKPDENNVCHPIEDIDDDGDAVFACKHCDREVPWRDEDAADESEYPPDPEALAEALLFVVPMLHADDSKQCLRSLAERVRSLGPYVHDAQQAAAPTPPRDESVPPPGWYPYKSGGHWAGWSRGAMQVGTIASAWKQHDSEHHAAPTGGPALPIARSERVLREAILEVLTPGGPRWRLGYRAFRACLLDHESLDDLVAELERLRERIDLTLAELGNAARKDA